MSTQYYELAAPITGLRVLPEGDKVLIDVHINYEQAGRFVVSPKHAKALLLKFAGDGICTLVSGSSGPYISGIDNLSSNTQLISEYGELVEVTDLKAKYA
jgi:hypothetical protein